jgi:hypothetical protein
MELFEVGVGDFGDEVRIADPDARIATRRWAKQKKNDEI